MFGGGKGAGIWIRSWRVGLQRIGEDSAFRVGNYLVSTPSRANRWTMSDLQFLLGFFRNEISYTEKWTIYKDEIFMIVTQQTTLGNHLLPRRHDVLATIPHCVGFRP